MKIAGEDLVQLVNDLREMKAYYAFGDGGYSSPLGVIAARALRVVEATSLAVTWLDADPQRVAHLSDRLVSAPSDMTICEIVEAMMDADDAQ